MRREALVLASYGNQGVVELPDGATLDCHYRRSVGRPYCGDRVIIESDGDGHPAQVVEILPRLNVFARADNRQRKQVVAANLQQILVVLAPRPEPSRDLVERYLVAAHSLEIAPVLVLNKADLMHEKSYDPTGPLGRLDAYRELGYPVVEASCKLNPGISNLQPLLRDRTSILAGQSGVGKSSLVNALIPDLELQTSDLSRVTGKGTHTTTTTIMYHLPGGGRLVDSPGVWEYGLWQIGQPELAAGFIEFRPLLGRCRFNDCRHDGEPSCAIRAAVAAGDISEWRYASYLRLLAQSA
jgi:ribosome biogenesis GTPase